MPYFSLQEHDLHVAEVHRNPAPALLYEHAIRYDPNEKISARGALVAYSGAKTGRSPKDKRIVKQPPSEKDVWWGPVNVAMERPTSRSTANAPRTSSTPAPRLYCVDGFRRLGPGSPDQSPRHLLAALPRLVHAHDADSTRRCEQLDAFGKPDYVIYNAGEFPANRLTAGMTSKTSIDLSFEDGEVVILGTEYAGEMKKGVFTIMNYLMPKRGILSMHCSATADRDDNTVVAAFRPLGHRQDHAVGRSQTPADRRRRALLDRQRHLQHRGRLLRQGDRPDPRERAGHFPGPSLRGRAGKRGPRRNRPGRRFLPTPASPRTRAGPTRSSSFATPRCPASPATRPT